MGGREGRVIVKENKMEGGSGGKESLLVGDTIRKLAINIITVQLD